jgi:PAS domain S-box-containing protein
MAIDGDQRNRILSRISVAAKTALAHPRSVEIAHLIGAGPSIRARARLALAAAFFVAAPTLFIGVMRTENVANHAAALSEYDDYLNEILRVRMAVKDLDLAFWAYSDEKEIEHKQAVVFGSEQLRQAIIELVAHRPLAVELGPKGVLEGFTIRLDATIKRNIAQNGSIANARLSLLTLDRDLRKLERHVQDFAKRERDEALSSLATVGRDQLILFLVLLFSIPVFVGFIPGWLVSPLVRLRQIASKIELGQLKDMPISGRDEVALLARSIKSLYLRKEEVDQKKSSKIFELRNLLRAVLGRIKEPVFIIDSNTRINYTNDAAAQLLGIASHQMEGTLISESIYAPLIKKVAEKAFEGDVENEAMPVDIEVANGRSFSLKMRIAVVRNRDGEVSRAVLVFFNEEMTRL